MSTLGRSFVTWTDCLRLPERAETGHRYELHDGEVTLGSSPRTLRIKLQKRIEPACRSSNDCTSPRTCASSGQVLCVERRALVTWLRQRRLI